MKTITKQELSRIEDIYGEVKELNEKIDSLVSEAESIVGENPDKTSWIFDMMHNHSYSLEKTLDVLNIKVE